MKNIIKGKVFVVEDNIDTDQIIPAGFLTLIPTIPAEYEKLGSYAMFGLPDRYGKFVKEDEMKSEYTIILAGKNFGCGSSREHAPICLGASGCQTVIAQSFARIFFRNCIATGELYPVESSERLITLFKTGDEVTVDLEAYTISNANGDVYDLLDMGEAKPVIDDGGIFNHARKTGMIKF
ncbi:MAG: 3-isopropylmalate dehydratase [Lentisphaeria bacterium]|nr:3-isopropylmalate dehydratase [Lentisphaeria bacterium]